MNRPIKFMAWDKMAEKGEEWFSWERLQSINYGKGENNIFNDQDLTLYQFTGLLDKDGKEIYEGHKIQWIHADSDYLVSFWRGHWVAVHHPDCASEVEGECKHDNLFHFKTEELEIIGHIAESE